MNGAPELAGLVAMGREEVESGIRVTLSRHDAGLRLVFDDTGTFDISSDGARIEWARPPRPTSPRCARTSSGACSRSASISRESIALHGSAVELGGVAIAFLAPKFHGKSTTAAALVDAGARLLADDIVAVSPAASSRPSCPAFPWCSSGRTAAARVAPASVAVPGSAEGRKLQRRWDAAERNAGDAAPLDGVYLLVPVAPGAPAGVRRTRLSGVEGALALLGQAKVGNLLGVERRAELLQATGEMADRVPVYRLEIPRDFEQLPDLTTALWQWHGTP